MVSKFYAYAFYTLILSNIGQSIAKMRARLDKMVQTKSLQMSRNHQPFHWSGCDSRAAVSNPTGCFWQSSYEIQIRQKT